MFIASKPYYRLLKKELLFKQQLLLIIFIFIDTSIIILSYSLSLFYGFEHDNKNIFSDILYHATTVLEDFLLLSIILFSSTFSNNTTDWRSHLGSVAP